MRPSTPAGFLSDCPLSEDHPGRLVPPRVFLETVDTVVREEGGIRSHFTPKVYITPRLSKELRSFLQFSAEQRSMHDKLLHAQAFIQSQQLLEKQTQQQQQFSSEDNHHELLREIAASSGYNHSDAEKSLSDFAFFEETPLIVIQPPTTAEVKRFGVSATSGGSSDGRNIQNQRSDFAKLLEDSLLSGGGSKNNSKSDDSSSSNTAPPGLLPSYPEPAKDANMTFLSDMRKKAAEAFVERCKQLWQMFEAIGSPNSTDIPPQLQKSIESGNFGSFSSRIQLLKQPLVYSLQVALCTQDIANGSYVGVSWDLLGGAAFTPASSSGSASSRKRIQLRDVFPSEEEARKQVEIAVLIHKIIVAICQPMNVKVTVEPSDLAVLAYFALPKSDGGDGTRLFELWPSGPLALFPIASFANFVPIKDAANASIDLVALSRKEDDPQTTTLRIRCSSTLDAQSLLQQEQERLQNTSVNANMMKPPELRIWKKPISSTIPENVLAAQEQARQKDPRRAIAKFMQGMKNNATSSLNPAEENEKQEKRKAALEMAMRLAGQQVKKS